MPKSEPVRGDDPNFLGKLEEAAARRMTAEERRQQKVSFIVGTMGSDSSITREKVREILAEQEGD